MKHPGALIGLIMLIAGCSPPLPPSAEAQAVRKHVVKLQEQIATNEAPTPEDRRAQRIKTLDNLQRSAALHREGLTESQTSAVQEAIRAARAYCTYENPAETLPMEIIQLEARCTVALKQAAEALQEPARRAKPANDHATQ